MKITVSHFDCHSLYYQVLAWIWKKAKELKMVMATALGKEKMAVATALGKDFLSSGYGSWVVKIKSFPMSGYD